MNFDVTPGGRPGGVALKGQNPFCSNIIMLHIKSKIMKSRIQWCKNFAPGTCLAVTRGQKVGLRVLFFLFLPNSSLAILARTLTLSSGNIPMNEDWRNAFGILMCRQIQMYAMALTWGYAMARHQPALVFNWNGPAVTGTDQF